MDVSCIAPNLPINFFFFNVFIFGFAGSSLLRADSSCSEQGLLSTCGARLFIAVASLVVEHRLISCPATCGIFPDQGSN